MTHLLVVDDEETSRTVVQATLLGLGYQVDVAESGEAAVAVLQTRSPDIILIDLHMEGMTGLELLEKVSKQFKASTPVMMTASATVGTAVEAMKNGAYDYLVKPFSADQLKLLVERIGEFRRLREENNRLQGQVDILTKPNSILTESPRLLKVLNVAKRVAVTDSTILISGESGTGKTLLAKTIHDGSARASGTFAVVNCATLSENLLESELFGHVKGSFTGAVKDKAGRLQVADAGTVFLDEIGEISPHLQTKLLRFLQDKEFERVGDTRTIRVDVRIIAATNKNLEAEVKAGRFREDLYFRLNVIELHMPSLRDRREDILPLVEQFLNRSFLEMNGKPRPLNEAAKAAILAYGWPGNIRELKNVAERAAILSSGDEITPEDFPDRVLEALLLQSAEAAPVPLSSLSLAPAPAPAASPSSSPTTQPSISSGAGLTRSDVSLETLEKQHIIKVLGSAATLEEAADILGINLSTLWRKRRRYGVE
jgi:DNA-binding NtrC family response regulator